MKNLFSWLVTSSADPTKVALTVKGFLGTVASIIVMVSPLFHLKIGSDDLNGVVDGVVQFITVAFGLVSATATIVGFIRKIYLTMHSPE